MAPRINFDPEVHKARNSFQVDLIDMAPKLNVDFSKPRQSLLGKPLMQGEALAAPKFEWQARQSLLKADLPPPEQRIAPRVSQAFLPQMVVTTQVTGMVEASNNGKKDLAGGADDGAFLSQSVTQTQTYTIESCMNAPSNAIPQAPIVEVNVPRYSQAAAQAPIMDYKVRQSISQNKSGAQAPDFLLKGLLTAPVSQKSEAPMIKITRILREQKSQAPVTDVAPVVSMNRIHNAKRPTVTHEEAPHVFPTTRQSLVAPQPLLAAKPIDAFDVPEAPMIDLRFRYFDNPEQFKPDSGDNKAGHLVELKSFHRRTLTLGQNDYSNGSKDDDYVFALSKEAEEEMKRAQGQTGDLGETSTIFLNVEVEDHSSIPELKAHAEDAEDFAGDPRPVPQAGLQEGEEGGGDSPPVLRTSMRSSVLKPPASSLRRRWKSPSSG